MSNATVKKKLLSLMKKLNLKLILIQLLGIFFFIEGIQKIYIASDAERFMCLLKYDVNSECWKNLNSTFTTLGDFLAKRAYWSFGAFVIGILIISLINLKNKKPFLNTFFVFLLAFLIFPTGIFFRGKISDYFNYFGGLFAKNYQYSFIISGIIFTLIGSLLMWRSYRIETV